MKKKDSKNYLDFVPEKNPEIEYEADEDGIITSLSNGKDFIIKSHKSCSDARESVISGLMSLEALYGMRSTGKRMSIRFPKNSNSSFRKWKSLFPV